MAKYLFGDNKPNSIDNDKFKRREAVLPSSNFVLCRVWWANGVVYAYERIAYIDSISPLIRSVSVESVFDGINKTSLSGDVNTNSIELSVKGVNPKIEEWFNRVESKSADYYCDIVILILDSDFKHYSRAYGIKNAFISKLSTNNIATTSNEVFGYNFTIEHSGIRALYLGDNVKTYNIYNANFVKAISAPFENTFDLLDEIVYIKSNNFSADMFGYNYHTPVTHFNFIAFI